MRELIRANPAWRVLDGKVSAIDLSVIAMANRTVDSAYVETSPG